MNRILISFIIGMIAMSGCSQYRHHNVAKDEVGMVHYRIFHPCLAAVSLKYLISLKLKGFIDLFAE